MCATGIVRSQGRCGWNLKSGGRAFWFSAIVLRRFARPCLCSVDSSAVAVEYGVESPASVGQEVMSWIHVAFRVRVGRGTAWLFDCYNIAAYLSYWSRERPLVKDQDPLV